MVKLQGVLEKYQAIVLKILNIYLAAKVELLLPMMKG